MRFEGKKYDADVVMYIVNPTVVRMDFKCKTSEEAEKLFRKIVQEEFLK